MTPNNPSPPSAAATDEAAFEAWFAPRRENYWSRDHKSVFREAFLAGCSSQRPSPSVGREEVLGVLRAKLKASYAPWPEQAPVPITGPILQVEGIEAAADAILALAQPATVAVEGEDFPGLNRETASLVNRFAGALAAKLRRAEEKYGYSDGWATADWEADCQRHLAEHVLKGDPLDVAAYAAFCWHHGWSTTLPAGEWTDEQVEAAARAYYQAADYSSWGALLPRAKKRSINRMRAALAAITPTAGGK